MTISVALCTYNGAAYLEDQLRSILGQTCRPAEIVVSDDASTDSTLAVVDRVFGERHERRGEVPELRLLRNPSSLGVTANFEQALAACSGDLIALSDQDDVWAPERLQRMTAEFARRPGLQLLHTDARLVDGSGQALGLTLLDTLGVSPTDRSAVHAGHALDVLLRRNIVTGATVMIRRDVLAASRPFPAAWLHDEWLAVIAAMTGEVDLLELPLTDYRQHGKNEIGVTALTLRGRIDRLTASRSDRNARLLARAQALAERVASPALLSSPDTRRRVNDKLEHELMRSHIPVRLVRRIGPVFAEWKTGRYGLYGLGLQDVARDLLQPA